MAKPVKFFIKGEFSVELADNFLGEYIDAINGGNDIIQVCIKTTSFNIFPIMRRQLKQNDPAFMVSGDFEANRLGESVQFKVEIDGMVLTESLKKKDLDAIRSGLAKCTIECVGSRDNWQLSNNCSGEKIIIAIATDE